MGMALLGNSGIRGAACCCCRREDITGFYFSKILVLNDNFQLLLKKRVLETFAFIYCLIVVGSKWGAGLENRCLERVGNLDGGSAQVLSHDSGMAQGRHWPQQIQTTIIIYCLKSSMFSAPMRSKTMGHWWNCFVELLSAAMVSQGPLLQVGLQVCLGWQPFWARPEAPGSVGQCTSHLSRNLHCLPHHPSPSLLLFWASNNFLHSLIPEKQTGRARGLHMVTVLKQL